MLEREVTLEACLTSNVHTGAISAVDRHPLVEWLRRGVRATLCSDNTLLSNTTTRAEVEQASRLPGMTADLLARTVESGHRAAFRRL